MKRHIPPPLRRPLAALVLALVLGVAAYTAASRLRHEALIERTRAQGEWRAAQAALDELPARIELVQRSDALYAELERRGFVGEEQRLRWVSALSRMQAERQLDSLMWRLEPRREINAVANLGASGMQLRIAPLDAAGLRPFLDRLGEEARGLFTVDRCDLALDEPAGRMECLLTWWTWQEGEKTP